MARELSEMVIIESILSESDEIVYRICFRCVVFMKILDKNSLFIQLKNPSKSINDQFN